jgi:hypothetical protein
MVPAGDGSYTAERQEQTRRRIADIGVLREKVELIDGWMVLWPLPGRHQRTRR